MVACPWVRLIAGETIREGEVAEMEEGGTSDVAASIVDCFQPDSTPLHPEIN